MNMSVTQIFLQEMPHIPDVGILHCGELPHHRMGIKVYFFFKLAFVVYILQVKFFISLLKGQDRLSLVYIIVFNKKLLNPGKEAKCSCCSMLSIFFSSILSRMSKAAQLAASSATTTSAISPRPPRVTPPWTRTWTSQSL